MPERKSCRARKVVDYGKFGQGESDDDFDDDFKESTPPVAKKPKLANKENKLKSTDKISTNKSRKSVDEKIYERELQAALELSMSQSDQSQGSGTYDADTADKSMKDDPPPVLLEREVHSPVIPVLGNTEIDPPSVPPRLKAANKSNSDDDIQVIETGIEAVPSSSRKRSTKARKYVDSDSDEGEDSDYEAKNALQDIDDEDDDSDEDYNEDDSDSDFGSKKKKANVKEKQTKSAPQKGKTVDNKQQNAGKSAKQSSSSSKSSASKSSKVNVSSPFATSSPSVSRTPTSCGTITPAASVRLQQTWKAPGAATANSSPSVSSIKSRTPVGSIGGKSPGLGGVHIKSPCLGGVNIKSPSSGLRLGLSRNMKSKPLHPNLKITN